MRRDFCKDLKALLAKITGPFYSIFPFITLHYLHHLLTSPLFSDRSAKLPARSCQEKRAEEETVRQRYFQRTHAISQEAHWRPDFVYPVLREDESQQVSFELVCNLFYFIWIQSCARNCSKELIKLKIDVSAIGARCQYVFNATAIAHRPEPRFNVLRALEFRIKRLSRAFKHQKRTWPPDEIRLQDFSRVLDANALY